MRSPMTSEGNSGGILCQSICTNLTLAYIPFHTPSRHTIFPLLVRRFDIDLCLVILYYLTESLQNAAVDTLQLVLNRN